MTAEVHQIEDVFLETAAPKAGPSIQEFRANAAVGANRPGHFAHIRPTGFAKGGNGVDRADPLGQECISGELGELAAPKVGAQDLLLGHPMGIDPREGIDRGRIVTTDQHTVWRF